MCDGFFPNLPPALSRGLGAFPCFSSSSAVRACSKRASDRIVSSALGICVSGLGLGWAGRMKRLARPNCAQRVGAMALTPLPAGRTASAPAFPTGPAPSQPAALCGRLFSTNGQCPRPDAVRSLTAAVEPGRSRSNLAAPRARATRQPAGLHGAAAPSPATPPLTARQGSCQRCTRQPTAASRSCEVLGRLLCTRAYSR